MKKERKLTDQYIIRIERISMRPARFNEVHSYMRADDSLKEGDLVREYVFEGEYKISDRKVVDLLAALLK